MTRIAFATLLMTLAACATAPVGPDVTNWSAAATAQPGFTGAGANASAVTGAGGTNVAMAFREAAGMSGTTRPWHVHYGRCGNDQGIVGDASLYTPLRPGSDGTATTKATIPVRLTGDRTYFINIHKSPSELSTIVACGNLSSPGMSMTSSSETTETGTTSHSSHH